MVIIKRDGKFVVGAVKYEQVGKADTLEEAELLMRRSLILQSSLISYDERGDPMGEVE